MTNEINLTQFEDFLNMLYSMRLDSVLFENESIRAINDNKTIVLIGEVGLQLDKNKTLALNNVKQVIDRINAIKVNSDAKIIYNCKDDDIINLEIKSSKASVKVRCANKNALKVPKKVNDNDIIGIEIKKEEVQNILSGIRVMSAKKIYYVIEHNRPKLQIYDSLNDIFNIELSSDISILCDTDYNNKTIVNVYDAGVFELAMKQIKDDSSVFVLGEHGTLTTFVKDCAVTLISQVDV